MDDVTTELLARVQVLESEVQELREQVEGGGIIFEMDMDEMDPELLLLLDDDGTAH